MPKAHIAFGQALREQMTVAAQDDPRKSTAINRKLLLDFMAFAVQEREAALAIVNHGESAPIFGEANRGPWPRHNILGALLVNRPNMHRAILCTAYQLMPIAGERQR